MTALVPQFCVSVRIARPSLLLFTSVSTHSGCASTARPSPRACRRRSRRRRAMNSSAALHVFAACSAEDASGWRRTRLENLKRTMRVWALPFECVGGGNRWRGFGEMAAQYAAAAERVPAHHHVVMLDSADAFAQGSADDVLAAFRRASGGRPIVLGLETGCPPRRCTPAPPAGGRPLGRAGPAGIPWLSYINGGFVMGEAWAAARLWRSTASNGCCGANKKFSAQLGIGRFARANAPMVAFDHAQELIAHVISSAKDNQWRAHYATTVRAPPRAHGGLVTRKRVRNRHSGVAPCFVHVPGVHESQRHEMMFRADARAAMRAFDAITTALVPTMLPTTMLPAAEMGRASPDAVIPVLVIVAPTRGLMYEPEFRA